MSLIVTSFESREICDEVIKSFNNMPISKAGGEEHLIQIRFSDTHEQKMLKQQTAAGRVFRAAEYEVGVAQARALGTPDRYLTISPVSQGPANDFEMYMQRGYRQPWAPTVPSTLGPARPAVYHTTPGESANEDIASEQQDANTKNSPATPAKEEEKNASPSHHAGHDD